MFGISQFYTSVTSGDICFYCAILLTSLNVNGNWPKRIPFFCFRRHKKLFEFELWGHKWIIISWRDDKFKKTTAEYFRDRFANEHFLTMHGMPHARLLWRHALLRGHYAAHSRHWGSSRMGLTRPGYETLVTGQLGFHLFLLARTTHRAKTQTEETQTCPLQYRDKQPEMVRNWVPMVASPDFTVRIFKFRIILQHNITQKRNY